MLQDNATRVLDVLEELETQVAGIRFTPEEVAEAADISKGQAKSALESLRRDGDVILRGGQYFLTRMKDF